MRRRAWKTRGKRGSALNKGMPIYDQMSGWRVKAERQPCQNLGFFGPVGSAQALIRLRLSKNFLRPTYSQMRDATPKFKEKGLTRLDRDGGKQVRRIQAALDEQPPPNAAQKDLLQADLDFWVKRKQQTEAWLEPGFIDPLQVRLADGNGLLLMLSYYHPWDSSNRPAQILHDSFIPSAGAIVGDPQRSAGLSRSPPTPHVVVFGKPAA